LKPNLKKDLEFPAIAPVSDDVERPLWSVIIPTYNCADYLVETLQSVLNQDPGSEKMQIEVVDDCSTKDDPEAVVKKIGQGRVSFFRQPNNVGAQANFNTCIQRATGHWVHILHGDDIVMSGFYKAFEQAFQKEPNIGAAFCRYIFIDEKGKQQQVSPIESETSGIISDWVERIAVIQRIQTPSIVVRRNVYEKLGGYHLELIHAADWEMWKRISVHYPVWYEPKPLACYRQHSTSDSSRLVRSAKNLSDTRRAIKISQAYLPQSISEQLSDRAREFYALHAIEKRLPLLLETGDFIAVIAQIQEALKCSRSSKVIKALVNFIIWTLKRSIKQI
jgi:glycosyltransferase involved in cell wall biosynthesis